MTLPERLSYISLEMKKDHLERLEVLLDAYQNRLDIDCPICEGYACGLNLPPIPPCSWWVMEEMWCADWSYLHHGVWFPVNPGDEHYEEIRAARIPMIKRWIKIYKKAIKDEETKT